MSMLERAWGHACNICDARYRLHSNSVATKCGANCCNGVWQQLLLFTACPVTVSKEGIKSGCGEGVLFFREG